MNIYAPTDLFVMCESANSKRSFQIWTNRKKAGFHFAGEWELPSGTGAITFADMGMDAVCKGALSNKADLFTCLDRDGTIDLVFPTCSSVSSTTGIGRTCSLNIAYNKQKPLCSVGEGNWLARLSGIAAVAPKDCREHTELCTGDANFGFDLGETSDVRSI
jgi:integrin alpha FG-GAP repeat containing protein 1